MLRQTKLFCGCLLFVALASGCGDLINPDDGGGKADGTKNEFSIKRVPSSDLKWDEDREIPNLDFNRVDVSPPVDWKVMARHSDYLVRFNRQTEFPRILVSVDPDPPFAGFDNVTEENLEAFTKEVQAELDRDKGGVLESALPMVIGDHACVRYVKGAKLTIKQGARKTKRLLDRQVLVTHVNGRRYIVDLQVDADTVKQHKNAGYAVLAGMSFHKVETQTDGGNADGKDKTDDGATKADADAKESEKTKE